MRIVGCTAVAFTLAATRAHAFAEGERTPMIGGAVIGVRGPGDVAVAGCAFEATWWWRRIGIATEGSRLWDATSAILHSTALGASLRLLLIDQLLESLIDPRDVELGLELHGVVERTWQHDDIGAFGDGATRLGAGVALRLRGGGDGDSALLAETRVFVRVMTGHAPRASVPEGALLATTDRRERASMVILGLGVAWGKGERLYVDRFRMRGLDSEPLVAAGR